MSFSADSASVVPSNARPVNPPVVRVKSSPCIRSASTMTSPTVPKTRLGQSVEEEERDAAEIRSIMQHDVAFNTPPTTFLGVSPPHRSVGAANPLVQDWNWQSNAYVSSHSNLQALREIDARGVSFLQTNGGTERGRLLVETPEVLHPGGASDSSTASYFPPQKAERCIGKPCTRVMAKPATCQVGFNVA